MTKWLKVTAFVAALSCGAAHADTATLQSHAFAIGKGPGVSGYTALLCGAGTLPIGQSGADPSCIALSGDATINAAGVLTLATVNANVGTFGSATQCITTTQNAKGLTTAISAATCTPAIGSVTGLGAGVATALGTAVGSAGAPVVNGGALGTPSSGVGTNLTALNGSNIASGTVPRARITYTPATRQLFTSGTNLTYTTPSSPSPIELKVTCKGGGGGGGGGAGSTTNGGNGGGGTASCFGTNATACTSPTVQGNGGGGGTGGGQGGNLANGATGGVGGSTGIGSFLLPGAVGANAPPSSTGSANPGYPGGGDGGGAGGGIGGAGAGGGAGSGGGGGGGGSNNNAGGDAGGAGGGSGGFSSAIITSPAASYVYTIGPGGTAGAAGTGGTSPSAGGAGGSGYCLVDEYYQ